MKVSRNYLRRIDEKILNTLISNNYLLTYYCLDFVFIYALPSSPGKDLLP